MEDPDIVELILDYLLYEEQLLIATTCKMFNNIIKLRTTINTSMATKLTGVAHLAIYWPSNENSNYLIDYIDSLLTLTINNSIDIAYFKYNNLATKATLNIKIIKSLFYNIEFGNINKLEFINTNIYYEGIETSVLKNGSEYKSFCFLLYYDYLNFNKIAEFSHSYNITSIMFDGDAIAIMKQYFKKRKATSKIKIIFDDIELEKILIANYDKFKDYLAGSNTILFKNFNTTWYFS